MNKLYTAREGSTSQDGMDSGKNALFPEWFGLKMERFTPKIL